MASSVAARGPRLALPHSRTQHAPALPRSYVGPLAAAAMRNGMASGDSTCEPSTSYPACEPPACNRGGSKLAKLLSVPAVASDRTLMAGAAAVLALGLIDPSAASAFEAHAEPGNALSLPTWAIHVSSVVEWATAMGLMWRFAEVTGNQRWKGMSWGMLPSLGSAMAACTWHFFYNSPDLEYLVVVQSALTVVGNCTCWLAAYRLYEGAMAEQQGKA